MRFDVLPKLLSDHDHTSSHVWCQWRVSKNPRLVWCELSHRYE